MKKRNTAAIERRSFPLTMERAAKEGSDEVRLIGHAAVFGQMTVLVPRDAWYEGSPEIREIIEAGAFAKTISERDVRAYWNHDSNIILGRAGNKTLFLREDKIGLVNEILPPDTQLIRDMVLAPIQRGDVNQQSFGFRVIRDKWEEEDNVITITLKELDLVEVSPCTNAQYSGTDIGLSARSADRIEDFRQQRQAAIQAPAPATGVTREGHPEQVQAEATPDTANHSEQRSAPDAPNHLDDDLFSRMEILQRRIAA